MGQIHSDKVNYYHDAFISFVKLELLFLLLAVVGEFGVHSAGYCLLDLETKFFLCRAIQDEFGVVYCV